MMTADSSWLRILAWPGLTGPSYNPYTRLLYSHLRARNLWIEDFTPIRPIVENWDVWHIHWPERAVGARGVGMAAAKAVRLLATLSQARMRGVRIVWTVHNLVSHDQRHPRIERWFWPHFVRRVDAVISLSEAGLVAARERHPGLASIPGHVIAHGHYRGAYPDAIDVTSARRTLGIDQNHFILLCFGMIRAYKGIERLVEVFEAIPGDTLTLVIAGPPHDSDVAAKLTRAARDNRVRVDLRHIPEDEVQVFMRAADLVVLPYQNILNSGAAMLALSFDRRVLAPALGALPELARLVGDDWVQTYTGDLTPDTLIHAISQARAPLSGRPALDPFDWEPIARKTEHVYRSLCATTSRR